MASTVVFALELGNEGGDVDSAGEEGMVGVIATVGSADALDVTRRDPVLGCTVAASLVVSRNMLPGFCGSLSRGWSFGGRGKK